MHSTALIIAGLATVASAITAEGVAKDLQSMTETSKTLLAPAQSIKLENLSLNKGPLPKIVSGLNDLTKASKDLGSAINHNDKKFDGDDEDIIYDAYYNFVHKASLKVADTITDKGGLLWSNRLKSKAPVATALNKLESATSDLCTAFNDKMEKRGSEVDNQCGILFHGISEAWGMWFHDPDYDYLYEDED